MDITIFNDFDNLFKINDFVNIIYVDNNDKKICKTKLNSIGENNLTLESQEQFMPIIPENQTLSIIYCSYEGLYGFHSKLEKQEKKENHDMVYISKPDRGWKIQRRQFTRFNINQESHFVLKDKKSEETKTSCLIYNIGEGGIGIETDFKLAIGQKIAVYIEKDKLKVDQPCIVVWGTELPKEQRKHKYKYFYGTRNTTKNKKFDEIVKKFEETS